MNDTYKGCWDAESHLEVSECDGRMHYSGTYNIDGITFSYWAAEQANGSTPIRGRIQVVSKENGFILKTRGPQQKNVERNLYLTPKNMADKSTWVEELKEKIEEAAMKLMQKHLLLIKRDAELHVTSESVSPQLAVLLYSDKFFRDRHRKAGDKLLAEHRRTLQSVYSHFPHKAMSSFTTNDAKSAMNSLALLKRKARLVWSFWDYCLSVGLCTGVNPIPEPLTARQSAAALQAKADRLDVLDLAIQAALYMLLLANPDARACGVALMLWGGFTAAEACKLKWKDLFILGQDYIAIKFRKAQTAGATHDFTRVLFIQAARILILRYQHLLESYSHEQIIDMPIVASPHDFKRPWKPNLLNQFGREVLVKCGINQQVLRASEEWHQAVATRVFVNTYASNLIHSCGLTARDGLFRFMTGKSLIGDVTQDHYNSFTSQDGLDSQFSVVRRMAPEEVIAPVPVDTSHPEYDVYTISPPTTLDHLYFSATFPGLNDGQLVQLLNDGGLFLNASATNDNP